MSVRAAISGGLSVAIAQLLGFAFPLYALIGAILVMDLAAERTRQLGGQRFVGTLLGGALGSVACLALGRVPEVNALVITLGILLSMLVTYLLNLKDAAKIAGYVCGVVMLNHSEQPFVYAVYRVMETCLGLAVALLVSFVPKLIRTVELQVRHE
jgi:uncharacterized membrane protein YgaE (UPF0421/DUF939 family)